jgi:hypothetical protein
MIYEMLKIERTVYVIKWWHRQHHVLLSCRKERSDDVHNGADVCMCSLVMRETR